MRAECIDAVNKAAQAIGKKLTVADVKNIEDKIREARKQIAKQDVDAYRAMTNEQQIEKAGEYVAKQALHDAIKKRQRADLTIIKKAEREAVMGRMMADGIDKLEALRRFTFSVADGKGKVVSFEAYSNGLSRYYLSKLTDFNEYVKESSFLGVMTNKKMRDDFEMESFGISSGNPKAKKAWDNLNAVRKEMIDHNNRLGGDIVPLANYRNPQDLSQFLVIRRGGKNGEAYINDHMQWVDRSEYVKPNGEMMNDAELRTFLHEAYITQASDGANKAAGMGGSVANRGKAHRQIHYKSPEAYRAAMEKYGSGNSFDQAIRSIESMSNDIALMEKFGPNATHEFNAAYSDAVQSSGGRTDKYLNSAWLRQSGQITTESPIVSHYVGELKSAMVAARLGSMLFSQISDLATFQAAARAMNIPMNEVASWVANVAADGDLRSTLRIHGLGVESALNTIVRFAEGATNTGMFGKFATAIPTIQGAHVWTKSLRQAFGAMLEAKVGDMAAKYDSMAKLPETDRKVFEAIGINDTDWAIYRLAKPFEYKGNKLMNAEAIENIPTSEIVKAIPEKVAQIKQDAADFIGRMEAQNQKEAGWVEGRQKKFAEYKSKIQKLIDDYIGTREKRVEDYSAMNLKRGGELMARLEQAEVEAEISTAAISEKDAGRSAKFMDDVKRGVEWYGQRRSEIGEQLGAKRHSAKLQAAAADRAYTKLSESIIAKKNELFGPERVEDGLVVIGKVTKAAKDFDAYTAKKEKQIERAKTAKQVDRAEGLKEDARIEFEAIKQAADNAIAELKSKVTGSQMEIRGLIDAIEAKKARAEAEADIAAYLQTEKSLDKIQGLLDTLDFRREQSAGRMFSKGEALGYRKAMAESRVKQMMKREEAYAKQADKEVFAKASEFEKRIDKQLSELEDFTAKFEEKAKERNQWAKEYESKIGSRIVQEAEIVRQDAAIKFLSLVAEQSEQAILQPGALSQSVLSGASQRGSVYGELGSLMTQFKSFPMAFFRQTLMERANFNSNKATDPWVFRAKMMAATTVLGGVSVLLNELASGKDMRDFEKEGAMMKLAGQGFLKGGGLGFGNEIVEAFYGSVEDPYRSKTKLLGPGISYIVGDAIPALAYGGAYVASGLENEKYQKEFSKALYKSTIGAAPGQNLWFLKGFLHNVMLDDLQEMANPGYKQRAKERIAKQGQEYWLGMD